MSKTLMLSAVTTETFGKLRADKAAKSFSDSKTTNTLESIVKLAKTCLNSFVLEHQSLILLLLPSYLKQLFLTIQISLLSDELF